MNRVLTLENGWGIIEHYFDDHKRNYYEIVTEKDRFVEIFDTLEEAKEALYSDKYRCHECGSKENLEQSYIYLKCAACREKEKIKLNDYAN